MTSDSDYSTIDREKLAKRASYSPSRTYSVDTREGNGCFMDPPGYPSYFTQCVLNSSGNDPDSGPTMLLLGHVVQRAEDPFEDSLAVLRSLYVPLPYEHPRVETWERQVYGHLSHCYRTDDPRFAGEERGIVIYPVPSYKLRHFMDDPRFSQEWRDAERAAVDEANVAIRATYSAVAQPENHAAVLRVRGWYPEAPIRHEWIAAPPKGAGNWYERLAERPTPETCPGDRRVSLVHPAQGWCQFCGYGYTA